MADLNYRVKVDTRQADNALGGLRNRVSGLGTALKALAGAFVVRELVQTIRQFQDLRQTLITIEGDAEKAAKSFDLIKKFTAQTTFQLDEVTKAFITFKNAGLNPTAEFMTNIGNIAAGMGKRIDDVAQAVFNATTGEFEMLKQLGIKVKVEGDKLRVNFRGTATTIENDGRSIIEFLNNVGKVNFAGSIERQSQTLTGALSNLQDSFALALNEVGEGGLTSALTEVARSMGEVVGDTQSLARTIGSVLGDAVRLLADNFKILAVAFGAWLASAAIARIAAMVTMFINMAKAIRTAVLATVALNAVMGKNLVYKLAQGLVALGGAAAAYFALSKEAVAGTNDELKEVNKSLAELDAAKDNLNAGGDNDFLGSLGQNSEKAIPDSVKNKINSTANSINDLVESYRYYNKETLQALDLNNRLIGQSEEQALLQDYLARATDKYRDELNKLEATKRDAELKQGPEKVAALEKIAEAENKLTKEYELQTEALKEKAARDIKDIENQRIRVFGLEQLARTQSEVRKIQNEIAKLTLPELEQKYRDIDFAAKEAAETQLAEFAKLKNITRDQVDPTVVKRYYEEAYKGVDRLKQITKEQFEESRKFSTGWKRAFRDYADEATNAAKQAERIFQKTTQGMEDMIVDFAKTGKFEFRGFVNSILEEILRSRIRELIAQVFSIGGKSQSSGFLGGIGSLLGFANGGLIPTNSPVLVGERGPELLSGAAGRVVTPNNQLGGNNITYNINAVDARSFKQLVAQDPGFIYAVTEQGRKSIPSVRR